MRPHDAGFVLLASELRVATGEAPPPPERLRAVLERLRAHV
jgi:hypothetical protein